MCRGKLTSADNWTSEISLRLCTPKTLRSRTTSICFSATWTKSTFSQLIVCQIRWIWRSRLRTTQFCKTLQKIYLISARISCTSIILMFQAKSIKKLWLLSCKVLKIWTSSTVKLIFLKTIFTNSTSAWIEIGVSGRSSILITTTLTIQMT